MWPQNVVKPLGVIFLSYRLVSPSVLPCKVGPGLGRLPTWHGKGKNKKPATAFEWCATATAPSFRIHIRGRLQLHYYTDALLPALVPSVEPSPDPNSRSSKLIWKVFRPLIYSSMYMSNLGPLAIFVRVSFSSPICPPMFLFTPGWLCTTLQIFKIICNSRG